MDYFRKKINLRNIFFSSTPGIISIILTFVSLPIYLTYLSPVTYSSFLVSHIFLSLSLVFNLNIGKIASINIQNKDNKSKGLIIFNALFLSILIAVFFSMLLSFILSKIFLNEKEIDFINIFFALVLSIIYINTESICKGLEKFKIIAISNLFFYGFSISGPSIFVWLHNKTSFTNKINLFEISIIFKIISLIFILFSILKYLFVEKKVSKNILISFKNQSFWMTLTNFYNQIFDYFDKYLIKLFLGPVIFINYTVAQQVASKLHIFSGAITSVMLPKLASQKTIKNKSSVLSLHLILFYISISLFILILSDYFDDIISWWLPSSSNININDEFFKLFNIFLALTFIAGKSLIIISLFEVNQITKKNCILETISLLPFSILLFWFISKENILLICYLILFKEVLLFLARSYQVKEYLISFKYYVLSMHAFLFFWFLNIHQIEYLLFLSKIIFFISLIILANDTFKKISKIN